VLLHIEPKFLKLFHGQIRVVATECSDSCLTEYECNEAIFYRQIK